MINFQKNTIEHTIIPLSIPTLFWQFIFHFFTLGKKNCLGIPITEVRKKCLINLYYLTTLHNQALRQAINNNVKHIFRTFGIVNSQFWEILTFNYYHNDKHIIACFHDRINQESLHQQEWPLTLVGCFEDSETPCVCPHYDQRQPT